MSATVVCKLVGTAAQVFLHVKLCLPFISSGSCTAAEKMSTNPLDVCQMPEKKMTLKNSKHVHSILLL